MGETYEVFVGIDWGQESHHVSVSDKKGDLLGERSVPHRGDALVELSDWLLTFADGDVTRIAVASEVPRGPMSTRCLNADITYLRSIRSSSIASRIAIRSREPRMTGDARVLSNAIRMDLRAFRVEERRRRNIRNCCELQSRRMP